MFSNVIKISICFALALCSLKYLTSETSKILLHSWRKCLSKTR